MLVAFDDLSFCSACVWLNCPLFCLSPHRIAKVEGVAGVVIVVQLEGPPFSWSEFFPLDATLVSWISMEAGARRLLN